MHCIVWIQSEVSLFEKVEVVCELAENCCGRGTVQEPRGWGMSTTERYYQRAGEDIAEKIMCVLLWIVEYVTKQAC
jgi:hypothetical protein